jgi:hypothetical protein
VGLMSIVQAVKSSQNRAFGWTALSILDLRAVIVLREGGSWEFSTVTLRYRFDIKCQCEVS